MIGFIKRQILNQKQALIRKRYPKVNIVLHSDLPSPSLSKITQLAAVVDRVNTYEAPISKLSDAQLRQKTDEFRQHILNRTPQFQQQLEDLEQHLAEAAIAEEKEAIKEKIKFSRNKIFEEILPEAFAVVREVSRRVTGMRHFDVQIAGGIVLHEGMIAEMATGEGKTLVATLPAYLNALLGRGVHVITVNDYLARRDSEWMGPIYQSLGLSVGVIQHEMSDDQRRQAYSCDITYGTNNEFGFDYLRDNMKYSLRELAQRPFFYAIVDEVDSILIDEARTPLIISGPAEESTEKYYTAKKIADALSGRRITEKEEIDAKYRGEDLSRGFDYVADEKAQTVALTEDGEAKAARAWGIESLHNIDTMEFRHHTIQALRAKEFFQRDVDYVLKDGQVVIVDEFTGRMMPGRRWSDGLHQAVESKEGFKIERENQTLATITFQNYFRMYEKLSGMTGTAFTEANEFKAIYKLDVVVMPTNAKLIRTNSPDCVYKTEKEKFSAVVEEIAGLYNLGRPVLVGTISIERSERLSQMLKIRGIPHQVLNAKYHEMEASIVAQAGRYKAVTIATNMAGRGTDILLGGNPEYMAKSILAQQAPSKSLRDSTGQADSTADADADKKQEYDRLIEKFRAQCRQEHQKVVDAGGLHVLGTERHEARRIDNQLRGRCGRQGDPGSSRFYVALEDELMRLFGSDRLVGIMEKLGLDEGQVIEHPWVSGSIEIAQRRVEQHNFEIRKQLLEYDNVMNKQREVVYRRRREILEGASLREDIINALDQIIENTLNIYLGQNQELDLIGLINDVQLKFGLQMDSARLEGKNNAQIQEEIYQAAVDAYGEKEKAVGPLLMRHLERMVFLQIIDSKWKDHLYTMDSLREGIGLRAYGQRDPLVEYKREAFECFAQMIAGIEEEAVQIVFRLQAAKQPEKLTGVFSSLTQEYSHPQAQKFEQPQKENAPESEQNFMDQQTSPSSRSQRSGPKVGRNDPCPCGSGKKYKKCHGK